MTETPNDPGPDAGPRVDTTQMRDLDRLRRSVHDRKVAGVAGGLGRHLDIDPTILRVAFVVLSFFGGAGLVLYAAGWLLIPEDGRDKAEIDIEPSTRNILLLVVAVVAVFLLVGDAWGGFGFPWPLAVLAVVAAIVVLNRPKSSAAPPGTPTTGTPATWAPGADTASFSEQAYAGQPPGQPLAPPPTSWMPPSAPYQPTTPRPDRGPVLFWFVLALTALGLGILGLYEVAGGPVADGAYPALALAIVGAMLVVGAWFGRPGGLIALGAIAAIALSITTLVGPNLDGDRAIDANPTSAALVQDRYELAAGRIDLDLTAVQDLAALDGREIVLDAKAGEIVVTVPDGIDVTIDADIGFGGEIRVEDAIRNGFGPRLETTIDGGVDVPTVELDLQLLAGSIEVRD